MTTTTPGFSPADTETFARLRPRLLAIAYRMLGVHADAEDVLQDAWMRWQRSERDRLQSGEAWLVTVTTRLAIDRLRAAKSEREQYIGQWLPEPRVEAASEEPTPEAAAERASEISLAMLWMLERLAPEERAAFLLRQVFDHDYDEIAALLGKSEAACRQMVHRAAERVSQGKARFTVPREAHRRLLERFVEAATSGRREAIEALLADNISVVSDGGGKVYAFSQIARGVRRIANAFWMAARKARVEYRAVSINGEPGLLCYVDGKLESAQAFEIENDRIVTIYMLRNPDKLARVPAGFH